MEMQKLELALTLPLAKQMNALHNLGRRQSKLGRFAPRRFHFPDPRE